MNITHIKQTSQRHADTFEADERVFVADNGVNKVVVKVKKWNEKRQTFAIILDGNYVTASSNYLKAIGEAVLLIS